MTQQADVPASAPSSNLKDMPPVLVSYQELVTIRTQLAMIGAQLQAALALTGRVDGLERRLGKVEVSLAGQYGERRTWHSILTYLAGMVSAAIGGGALMILPKFWGG